MNYLRREINVGFGCNIVSLSEEVKMDINKICPHCLKQIDEESICPYCKKERNEMPEGSSYLRPFTILQGKYLLGDVLGEGGFKITYKAMEIDSQMPVAISEFYPDKFVTREEGVSSLIKVNKNADVETVKLWKKNFLKEARLLLTLAKLPTVASVKDYFCENNTVYMVRDYLEGEYLKNIIKSRGGRIPAEELLRTMEPVIKDLCKVHELGFIHGNISPDNMMILKSGNVKVLNFDMAIKVFEDNKSIFIMPGYTPEEQYRTKGKIGPWSDVYAICATMYKCITGITPMESMERLRDDKMMWPGEMGIFIDSGFETVLKKGMAILAENRIQDMRQLYDAIYSGNIHKEYQYSEKTLEPEKISKKYKTPELKKCLKGHYYDSGEYKKCPYCDKKPKRRKCSKGHYYDGSVHNECPYCEKEERESQLPLLDPALATQLLALLKSKSEHPKLDLVQEEYLFNVYLSQYSEGEQVYCCVMHHPLRSCGPRTSDMDYPVDYIDINYNGLLKEQCVFETEKEKLSIILNDISVEQNDTTGIINLQAQWDEKVTYHLPIYDAMESWDFVFSRNPINVDRYLEGYVYRRDNTYACEKDLIEWRRRYEKFRKSWDNKK